MPILLLTRYPEGGTASSREFYYENKGKQTGSEEMLFRTQADADNAVLEAASLLGVQR